MRVIHQILVGFVYIWMGLSIKWLT